MIDINAPVNPEVNNPTTPVTPSPDPMAASSAAAPAGANTMPPQPQKKSKKQLILLVLLVLIGLGYVYYTYFMTNDDTPAAIIPTDTLTGNMMMTNTGDTELSGDMMGTGDLDELLGTGEDTSASGNEDLDEDMIRQADLQEISMALALYREEK